ncbi:MAG: TrbI/VirB10 family protein [Cyanobacteria bacterium P01_A01_bin.84]
MTLNFREEDEKNISSEATTDSNSERSIIDQHLAIDDENESSDSDIFTSDNDDEEDEAEPTKAITKYNFASSPWSMMSAVGGAFFVVFGGGYLFLNSVFNGSSASIAEDKEIKIEENSKLTEENDGDVYAKLALKQQQDELAKLNNLQGMDDEEVTEEIEKAKKEGGDKTDTKQKVAAKPKPRPKPAPRRVARRSAPARRPSPRPAPRPRAVPVAHRRPAPTPRRSSVPKPQPRPVRRATPPSGVSKVAKNISREPQVAKDPLAELNRLRNIGSFGKIDYSKDVKKKKSRTAIASTSSYETPRERRLKRRREQGDRNGQIASASGLRKSRTSNSVEKIRPKWKPVFENKEVENPSLIASNSPVPTNASFSQINPDRELDFIEKIKEAKIRQNGNNFYDPQIRLAQNKGLYASNGQIQPPAIQANNSFSSRRARNNPRYLMVGEHASGRLLTPITQSQEGESSQSNRRFVAKLTEDIIDNRGEVAIPRETLLAVRINSVDGASVADVEVTAIIKNGTEYPIPPGTISVYGKKGRPLVAKQFGNKGGEIAQNDTTIAVMGSLAKVGEVINQPEEEETIEDPFTGRIRSRRRNSRRNIGGAVLEGAFGELTDTVKKRAETANEEIASRPSTWYIKAGKKLTFVVNDSVQLPSEM